MVWRIYLFSAIFTLSVLPHLISGCGTVPSIENGIVSFDGNSSFGSVADVMCDEGYDPSSANITCLMTGSWENVSCTVKDCGPLQELNFGQYKLINGNSTMFGSVANVTCDSGYSSDKLVITCQSSAKWETAMCSINGTTPALHPTEKNDTGVDKIIIIVVLVLCLIILLQLLVMCYLQCQIHTIRRHAMSDKSEVCKRIVMTIFGSIPVVGLIPIYITWKLYMNHRDIYKVKHNKQKKEKSLEDCKGASNPTYGNNNMPINKNAGDYGADAEVSGIELEYKTPETNIHVEHG